MGSAARQERSKERAVQRTRYVLRRIVDEPFENLIGPITDLDRLEQEQQICDEARSTSTPR